MADALTQIQLDVRVNLAPALEAAVPLRMMELRALGEVARGRLIAAWAAEAAEQVAHHGDLLMFRGKKAGESARVFNALAKGLAAAAFVPGGVTFAGIHFEERPTMPEIKRWTTSEQIDNEFGFHPANDVTGPAHDLVRTNLRELAHRFNELLPECPLKTTAINTLREAMWASNAAIATAGGSPEWQAHARAVLGLDEPEPVLGTTVELPEEDQA